MGEIRSTSRNTGGQVVFLSLNALGRLEMFAEGAKAEEGSLKANGFFTNSTRQHMLPASCHWHIEKPLLNKEELSTLG